MGPTGLARRILRHDARGPVAVAVSVAFLLVPMPGAVLDVALLASFGAAALHLAAAADTPLPRAASGFGTLTTGLVLLRTALAFAVTRHILAGAPAEGLVAALGASLSPFGPVAGMAVLLALALVHLLVVARGVERSAQVAARFALDALPGRQLALESAARSGEADAETLRRRRADLGAEATLAGAMDGAARFLRGEATALLALTAMNAIAGIAAPVFGRDAEPGRVWPGALAAATGAGLAILLPALLSGVAVAVFGARRGEAGSDGGSPAFGIGPAPIWTAAAVCALVGAVPGAPLLATVVVTGAFAALAVARARLHHETTEPSAARPSLRLTLHPEARAALGEAGLGVVLDRVRRHLTLDHGLPAPEVQVDIDPSLPAEGYVLDAHGAPAVRGRLRGGKGLSLSAPPSGDGADRHPRLGLPAAWTDDGPLGPVEVLFEALDGALRRTPGAVLSVDVVAEMLSEERRRAPARVAAVVPGRVDLPGMTRLLAALLADDLPLAPLGRVLEALARAPAETLRDDDDRLRTVRRALADATSARYAPGGALEVLCPDGRAEDRIARTGVLSPSGADAVYEGLEGSLRGSPALVLLVSPETRAAWARLVNARYPGLPVLSAEDVRPDVRIRPTGLIGE
jgi:flagellar biosynthesis component FlhA